MPNGLLADSQRVADGQKEYRTQRFLHYVEPVRKDKIKGVLELFWRWYEKYAVKGEGSFSLK